MADIGTPVEFNVIPDPHEVNAAKVKQLGTWHFYDAQGNTSALGSNSLIMMFLGLFAANNAPLSVKILADFEATHSMVSADEMNLVVQQQQNWLTMPSGASVVSTGSVVISKGGNTQGAERENSEA